MRLTDQQNAWIMRVWGAAPGRDRLAAEKARFEGMLADARTEGRDDIRERDEAREKLAAVAALADEYVEASVEGEFEKVVRVDRLRAALADHAEES